MIIKKAWESYRENVVPKEAQRAQIIETRRAFYAGVSTMLEVMRQVGEPGVTEELGVAILSGVNVELKAFRETVGTEQELDG